MLTEPLVIPPKDFVTHGTAEGTVPRLVYFDEEVSLWLFLS